MLQPQIDGKLQGFTLTNLPKEYKYVLENQCHHLSVPKCLITPSPQLSQSPNRVRSVETIPMQLLGNYILLHLHV